LTPEGDLDLERFEPLALRRDDKEMDLRE
jgi:hypothetical protein